MNVSTLPTSIRAAFWSEKTALDVAWIRFIIFGGLLHKLLSRDFSVFGFAPREVLELYPSQLFPTTSGYALLGVKPLVDLVTFHWLHWLLPIPSPFFLATLQCLAISACLGTILFGRSMSAALPITAFLINSYLWGYCWRSGAEVDAVFMLMQLNLLYCFFKGKEAFVIARNFTPPLATSREYGAFYSLALLVFISYYFSSGLNKAVDIQLSDWFRYDLVQEMRESYRQSFFNAPASIWPLAPFAEPISMFLKLCGVPAAYAMELTIPLVFVWRRLLLLYAMFFIAFHFITWSVGILFFGDIIAWFSLIPVGTLFGKYRQQLRAR